MLLESRLEELVEDGSQRDAAELATAALKNDEVIDVEVGEDAVTVETRRFRGVHDVRRDGGQAGVVQQGEYEPKGDLEFRFTTATMHDDALDAARAELAGPEDDDLGVGADDAGGAGDTDAAESASASAATDGGSEPTSDDGVVARLAATVGNIFG